MTRWLQFIFLLLAASAFAHAPVPKDLLFAKDGFTLSDGTNTFTVIAQNSTGAINTNSITVNPTVIW